MRVLVVPKWYPWPDRPVFGSFCREQALALSRRHDVIVLASDAVRSPRFRAFELSDSVEREGLRTIRLRYRRPRLRPAAMAFQLAGMVVALARLRRQRWRPDVVHAHVYSAGLPALLLGALSRAPVVVTEHYTGFQRGLVKGYDRLIARLVFNTADLVAPVSDDLARQLRAIAPRAHIVVVGNVVDTDVFHPSGQAVGQTPGTGAPDTERRETASSRDAGPRLLTVAALTEKKGHRYLFEALATLRAEQPATLELIGDGELRGALESRARELGLADAVSFYGERSREDVALLMRQVDLFVLPSIFENQPCVLIEAMASGLPSVATAVGGVPELLDGTAGWLCRAGDPRALAAAILTALGELGAVDRASLARQARERFGYEAFSERWTSLYAGLRQDSHIAQDVAAASTSASLRR